jgi:DNA topoisomerase-1
VVTTGIPCPRTDCGGRIIEKKSAGGKVFYGCSHYQKNQCNAAFWYPPLISGGPDGGNRCPDCNNLLIFKILKRGDIIACSNSNKCTFQQLANGKETHA